MQFNNRSVKIVKPADVVNSIFAPNLFRIKGGKALYDEVYMSDGGIAVYLVRVTPAENGKLHVLKRWIPWDIELEQMYD